MTAIVTPLLGAKHISNKNNLLLGLISKSLPHITGILLALILVIICVSSANAQTKARHFPGVFFGFTDTDVEVEFTWGIEYEYKFLDHWGIGAAYEKSSELFRGDGLTVNIVSIFYHPIPEVRLNLGGGRERIGGDQPYSGFLFRFGIRYDFYLGDFGIAPTLAIDFADDKTDGAYVYGLTILRPF